MIVSSFCLVDMKKILLNASNLHAGGGVQVATSVVSELPDIARLYPNLDFYVFASSSVDSNLRSIGFDFSRLKNYRVVDVTGLGALKSDVAKRFKGFDLVFTVFGPLYSFFELPNHIVGFAQPWIIYPDNEIARTLGLRKRIQTRFKYFVQWMFFRRAARLVVELQHVQVRLEKLRSFPAERVDIVNNCVSSIYFDEGKWVPVQGFPPRVADEVRLGFVSRDYPHKNIDFLLELTKVLRRISRREYSFFVTLSDVEWNARSEEFRQTIRNVGSISVAQCPCFYREIDAVVFPSFLECFSATPLEAMVMKKPLFASNRGFVRDCCGTHASYFDPLDAEQAAKCIDDWFEKTSDEARAVQLESAYRHVLALPGSRQRAELYVQIIADQFNR